MAFSTTLISFITGLGIFLGCVAVGLLVIAAGDMMLALREIALNTRKETRRGEYRILLIVAAINNWLGAVIIIGGAITAGIVALSGF